jgi:hypothetical protein
MEAAATAIRTPQNARITDALIQDSDVVVHRFDRDQAGGAEQARSGLRRLDDTIVGSACFDQVAQSTAPKLLVISETAG